MNKNKIIKLCFKKFPRLQRCEYAYTLIKNSSLIQCNNKYFNNISESTTLCFSSFESLPRIFLEEDTPALLRTYDVCISYIIELTSQETSHDLLEFLENILTQIKWQQERIGAAYASRIIEEHSPKITADGQLTQEAIAKHNKSLQGISIKDKNASYRQEVIRLSQRRVSENGLCDLIGLEDVKNLLKKSVLLPLSFPSLFTGGRKPWTQILLYGPPGTGKSKIAHALAAESKAQLYCISSADLLSSWVGESEKMIKDLFQFARSNKEKCIVFIDEIDSICRKRNAKEGDHSRSIKNQLLIELDENGCGNKCFVLCATNCPWDIDAAFLRRFQCRIFVPLPSSLDRIEIIHKSCDGICVDIDSDDWKVIAERTDGYSGADLVNLTNFALQEPLGELENNQTWIVKNDKWIPCASNTPHCVKIPISLVPPEKVDVRDVLLKDFIKALEAVPKTIHKDELERYQQFSRTH